MRKSLLLSSLIFFIIIGLYGQNHSQNESDTEYHPSPSNRYIHYPGTFYTQYYGVRYGNTSAMILNPSDTLFYLQDNDAAIGVYLLGQGSTTFPLVPNTYYNPSNIWGNPPSTIYENYVLDAYWAALQYVYYLRNHFNCPKDFFQRYYSPGIYGSYGICDTTLLQTGLLLTIRTGRRMMLMLYPKVEIKNILAPKMLSLLVRLVQPITPEHP